MDPKLLGKFESLTTDGAEPGPLVRVLDGVPLQLDGADGPVLAPGVETPGHVHVVPVGLPQVDLHPGPARGLLVAGQRTNKRGAFVRLNMEP